MLEALYISGRCVIYSLDPPTSVDDVISVRILYKYQLACNFNRFDNDFGIKSKYYRFLLVLLLLSQILVYKMLIFGVCSSVHTIKTMTFLPQKENFLKQILGAVYMSLGSQDSSVDLTPCKLLTFFCENSSTCLIKQARRSLS